MKRTTGLLLLTTFAATAQGQQSGCFAAYQNQLANYEVKVSDTRYLNSIYDKVCQNSTSVSTDSMDLGVKAVIDSTPVGLTFGSGSTKERADFFCRTYKKDTATSQNTYSFIYKISDIAAKGLESCLRADARNVKIGIATQDRSISVNITPMGGVPVKLIAGTSTNLTCTTTNGVSPNPSPANGIVPVESFGMIAVNCTRSPSPNPQNPDLTAVFDSSELTLNIAAIDVPLQMGLPASELVGRVDKQIYESKITQLENQLRPFTASLSARLNNGAKCVAAFDGLPAARYQRLLNNTGYWMSFDKAQGTFRVVGANGTSDQATGTLTSERQGTVQAKAFGIYDATIDYTETGALSTGGKGVGQLFCPPLSN